MPVLAVLLAVVGIILIVSGIVYFAHGAAMDSHGESQVERPKLRFAQVPYRELLRLMPRCVKVLTDSTASHRDRVMAAGAFPVVVGIVLIFLAVLAGIAALL